MAIENPKQLGLITIMMTFGGFCWLLSLISLLATRNWMWQFLNYFQSGMQSHGFINSHAGGPCPLCGMSRAFRSIWQGHIDQALSFNPNSLFLFSVMAAGCVLSLILVYCLYIKNKGAIFCRSSKTVQQA